MIENLLVMARGSSGEFQYSGGAEEYGVSGSLISAGITGAAAYMDENGLINVVGGNIKNNSSAASHYTYNLSTKVFASRASSLMTQAFGYVCAKNSDVGGQNYVALTYLAGSAPTYAVFAERRPNAFTRAPVATGGNLFSRQLVISDDASRTLYVVSKYAVNQLQILIGSLSSGAIAGAAYTFDDGGLEGSISSAFYKGKVYTYLRNSVLVFDPLTKNLTKFSTKGFFDPSTDTDQMSCHLEGQWLYIPKAHTKYMLAVNLETLEVVKITYENNFRGNSADFFKDGYLYSFFGKNQSYSDNYHVTMAKRKYPTPAELMS